MLYKDTAQVLHYSAAQVLHNRVRIHIPMMDRKGKMLSEQKKSYRLRELTREITTRFGAVTRYNASRTQLREEDGAIMEFEVVILEFVSVESERELRESMEIEVGLAATCDNHKYIQVDINDKAHYIYSWDVGGLQCNRKT